MIEVPIGLLIVASIAFVLVVSAFMQAVIRRNRCLRDLEFLLEAGWKVKRLYSRDFLYTYRWSEFIAPDETESRPFREALERQRALDERKRLNLPDESSLSTQWRAGQWAE